MCHPEVKMCSATRCGAWGLEMFCKDHRCIACDDKKVSGSLYCDAHTCYNLGCSNISTGEVIAGDINDIINNILNEGYHNIEYYIEFEGYLIINRVVKNSKLINDRRRDMLVDMLKDMRSVYLDLIDYHCIACVGDQIKFLIATSED